VTAGVMAVVVGVGAALAAAAAGCWWLNRQEAIMRNSRYTIFVYRDARREWRWRAVSRNGRIIAEGGEGYKRKLPLLTVVRNFGAALGAGLVDVRDVAE